MTAMSIAQSSPETPMMPPGISITQDDQDQFARLVPILTGALRPAGAAGLDAAEDKYVEVVPQWWGLVFVLSTQAVKDLSGGTAGISAVAAAIAAVCTTIPPAAAIAGIVSAILGLLAAVLGLMDRGNGIYITALWPVVALPGYWVPTPR